MRILVVDDSSSTRAAICKRLTTIGFRLVDEAEDGLAALEMLRATHYHLVISDWQMPRMTGVELLRAVRADPSLARLPVLLVLGFVTKALLLEAAAAGASGFLARPCVEVTLAEKVESLLASGHPRPTPSPWNPWAVGGLS